MYFQDCKKVIIQYILLTIIGPYGRGISFIKYDITITNGDVLLEYVRVDHFGNHASGIHFEVFTDKRSRCFPNKESLLWRTLQHEAVSGPNHVSAVTVDLNKPVTMSFILGKQKDYPILMHLICFTLAITSD